MRFLTNCAGAAGMWPHASSARWVAMTASALRPSANANAVCRPSWKWRERSAVKITERTREKTRKRYIAEEKVAILRRHLLDQEPISKLCDELGLQPTVFYRWHKEFFENGAAAFQTKAQSSHPPQQERIEYLEKKIRTKDEVLVELMAEHVALKKSLGEI